MYNIQGLKTGDPAANEFIVTSLIPLSDLIKIPDCKAMAALLLYMKYTAERASATSPDSC